MNEQVRVVKWYVCGCQSTQRQGSDDPFLFRFTKILENVFINTTYIKLVLQS